MLLFRPKITPFSSFTINLGPLYVERVFDSILTKQGVKDVVRMAATDRFEKYLELLRNGTSMSDRHQYTFIQFYKGHFCQQLANHLVQPENALHFHEKALCYYQTYLELSVREEESRYYAQWQMGLLQDTLKYPWLHIEDSLLKAHAIDPLRGEAFKKLIEHYVREKEWKTAYAYSSVAANTWFDKNPAAVRKWFVDFQAYNWNVINTHITICYKLGYLTEAKKAYEQMLNYELHHLNEFKESDIRHIHFLEKIFHGPQASPRDGLINTSPMEQPVTKQAPSNLSFRDYVLIQNKTYCMIILGLMILQWIIFKLCYPFPDFFSDSYSYIQAAHLHLDVNIWPIGYSRFLVLFQWFSTSGSALVFFQFLIWSVSALYFYLTITYFYLTGKNTRIFLCIFLFFNPLWLYVANYVTSDMLFISMSTIWLTQLIFVLHRPRLYHVFVQAILVFIMFTFRYNAMIYPLIAAGVFLLSKQKAWVKALGIVSAPILIIPFILWSSQSAKTMTGTAQFPPILGGWQWANNALYFRGFIEEDSNAFPNPQTAELDRIARKFFSQPYRPQDLLFSEVANFFIRHPEAPLKQYMSRHYNPKTVYEDIQAWGKSAVVFDQYGKFLIKRHPWAFARYYLLVNTKNYFIPPLEKLEIYNLGEDTMWPTGQAWFRYPSPKVWSISKELQGTVLALFPIFFLILNLYYAISLLQFIRRDGFRKTDRAVRNTILTITIFLALNAAFSIFANIIVIRYQIFPMLVFLSFAMLLTDYVEILSVKAKRSVDLARHVGSEDTNKSLTTLGSHS